MLYFLFLRSLDTTSKALSFQDSLPGPSLPLLCEYSLDPQTFCCCCYKVSIFFKAASVTVKVLIDSHSSIKIHSCKSSLSVLLWPWCSKGKRRLDNSSIYEHLELIAHHWHLKLLCYVHFKRWDIKLPIMPQFFCKIPWQKQLRRERFIRWTVPSPSPSLWGNQGTSSLNQQLVSTV